MTNAVPPGRIDTSGSFGPWVTEEPGFTGLQGQFTFDRADLAYFKGIAGTLSARGTYEGALGRIEVRGETSTPDFTVKVGGHPVPLTAKYHSIVDGTNGDTALERIDATFLNTSLVARGGVFDVKGVAGRLVTLDITMEEGRLEDIMTLAVNTPKPPMTGTIHLETKFDLPPGDKDVVEKLQLNGRFAIKGGRFTNRDVALKIAELSRKARVDDDESARMAPSVASDFSGRFSLGSGVLALPIVTFDVPGAAVRLAGRYGLESEAIDFAGSLYMDAKISQTTTGWRSLLLKMVDPLFRQEGRTVVPIKIQGTRNAPAFGLDVKRVFNRNDPMKPPPPKPKPAPQKTSARANGKPVS
jgi:AsmA-like C-terminal region